MLGQNHGEVTPGSQECRTTSVIPLPTHPAEQQKNNLPYLYLFIRILNILSKILESKAHKMNHPDSSVSNVAQVKRYSYCLDHEALRMPRQRRKSVCLGAQQTCYQCWHCTLQFSILIQNLPGVVKMAKCVQSMVSHSLAPTENSLIIFFIINSSLFSKLSVIEYLHFYLKRLF